MEAFVRIGNETVTANAAELKRLVLRGRNSSYDSLISSYNFKDYSFSKLRDVTMNGIAVAWRRKILNRLVLSTVMEN